ncbi:MAG TPA: histidine phosphatase family protein [Acidimicrobiia bacterium]|jgi:broad specificity phosphatase PhoE|nr:histidine phosphatase family protein [Acidimicrobiia bacterium]
MAARIHLVRHGEVHNPDHLVYASLPGFRLSPRGEAQARAVARYLGRQPIVGVWSSPLERALLTAEPLAQRVGLPVKTDDALTEWQLMARWAGISWEDIPKKFPGELEAFLDDPTRLDFSPESLDDLARRIAGTVQRLHESHPHGDIVVVSHSAPIRAGVLRLTGSSLSDFWADEPGHGAVTTLRPGAPWEIETVWVPETE